MVRNYEALVQKNVDKIENPDQQATVKKHIRYCKDKGQSIRTIHGKMYSICCMGRYFHDRTFESLTKEDIMEYIDSDEFRGNYKPDKAEIAQSTLGNYLIILRTFLKWVHFRNTPAMKKKGAYPDCVDWIEIKQVRKETTPDQLFTEQEVFDMINSCQLLRDKLYIALLWDTAGRLSEILDCTEDKVLPDDWGYTIILDGKTGPRRVRLNMSVPFLKQYLGTRVPGRPLIRTAHGRMSDTRAQNIVRDVAKAAGITRKVYPHLFRHTGATRLADKLTESQLKVFAGWTANSIMPGHYVHMSGAQIDSKMKQIYGLEVEEEEEKHSILDPIKCPVCGTLNPSTKEICVNSNCMADLTGKSGPMMKSELDIIKDELKQLKTIASMRERMDERKNMWFETDQRHREYVPPVFPDTKYPQMCPEKLEMKPQTAESQKAELEGDLEICMHVRKHHPTAEIDRTIAQIQEALASM